MKIFNTLTGKKEELRTLSPYKVKMYVCGPTTYNYIHLGNARPLVVFDAFRRYLQFRGYEVNYVQNFTDVDDKIINRARDEGQDPMSLAERYINEYFKDADALNVRRADVHPRVSENIPEIIEAVKLLMAKGYAYEVQGDVFFRVRAFSDYGKLSGRSLKDMLAGARVEVDERKEEPVDFALWKSAKEGELCWDSPWGRGRPGWHIECSVMAIKYLGETIDIHGGGNDLIFPHHENEIAQSEAITGKPFANYWMHNGFITVNKEKMSKSLGNFFILRDILEKYPADAVRFYLIATHYRSPLDFDDSKLEEARKALGRLKNTLDLCKEFKKSNIEIGIDLEGKASDFWQSIEKLENDFIEAMDDDFNTAKALGFLFEMSHQINAYIAASNRDSAVNQAAVGRAVRVFTELGNVLGIFMEGRHNEMQIVEGILPILAELSSDAETEGNYEFVNNIRDFLREIKVNIEDGDGKCVLYSSRYPDINVVVKKLIEIRTILRQKKEYQKADFIRDSLRKRGIILEDTREGVRWKFADL